MTNLPVLYRNIMDGLPNDLARDVFLWAVERPGEDRMCYRAEAFAREAVRVIATFAVLAAMADSVHVRHGRRLSLEQFEDLLGFVAARHANWRYGGNQRPTYARAAE